MGFQRLPLSCVTAVAWLLIAVAARGAEPDEPVDYVQDVKPILSRRCYACHGALKQKNGLRLDTAALAVQGGDSGPALVPGKSGESLMLDAVRGANGASQMPPEGEPLKPAEIEILRRWIEQGAKAPAEKTPQDPAKHWSYQPPVRPNLPEADLPSGTNPIDAFLAAARKRQGLMASPPAARHILLRRVYLDLIGLPPTRGELEAFLADDAPDAYARVVDRLLENPRYGERWGRHWMDVWRYSDWDGYMAEVRESQPHIWRWRDWIIESLNADKPYDRMIVEMLAGDEVAPSDPDVIRATGFLVRNWYKFSRNVWLDFTIEHTSKAFLGTTLNCARCHDHMYDPLAQRDYYAFRAIFEPHTIRTDRVPGQPDPVKDGLARVFDEKIAEPTFLFVRGDEKRPDKDAPLSPAIPVILAKRELSIEPIALAPTEYYPGLRPWVQQENLANAKGAVASARDKWLEASQALTTARRKLADFKPNSSEGKPANEAATPFLVDDFAAAKPDVWTIGPGQWEYRNGRLIQSAPGESSSFVISVKSHPSDFVARVRFKTTGGTMWKSVGLSFDVVEDQTLWAAYLSGTGTGKLSIFRRIAGKAEYFEDGIRDYPVELNREYELQVAVRGNLVNMSVDGKLEFVYTLPGERAKEGRFTLWTYDATAEFSKVTVESLAADARLYEKVGDVPAVPASTAEVDLRTAVEKAEAAAEFADKTLLTARAALEWTQARIAADLANYATPPAAEAKELSFAAGRAEREHAVRLADQNVLSAEQKLAGAKVPKRQNDAAKKAITDAEAALAAATKARQEAQAKLAEPLEEYKRFGPVYPQTSSGRRSALARWIAARDNPLTARVAVNQIWLRHFGSPLVPTVFDFGLNGRAPTHPELLDWLAVELMEPTRASGNSKNVPSPWRMKPIHRLIVTSDTYRQQSATTGAAAEANRKIDPDNLHLWRMNVRRMEAEVVRDSTLHAAGKLDTTMGGPDLDPNTGMTNARRSVYFRNSKEKKMTFLDLFDRPNVVECYRRAESIVPQQALAMANSPLSLAQARLLAKQLSEEVGSGSGSDRAGAFVGIAFRQVLGRSPTDAERGECEAFLAEQTKAFTDPQTLSKFTTGTANAVAPAADPHQRARENLIHVLFNHNDFLTVR